MRVIVNGMKMQGFRLSKKKPKKKNCMIYKTISVIWTTLDHSHMSKLKSNDQQYFATNLYFYTKILIPFNHKLTPNYLMKPKINSNIHKNNIHQHSHTLKKILKFQEQINIQNCIPKFTITGQENFYRILIYFHIFFL